MNVICDPALYIIDIGLKCYEHLFEAPFYTF